MVAGLDPQPAIVARVVHSSPGRLRLRLPREAVVEENSRPILDALGRARGVHGARIGHAACSLLVAYDPRVLDEQGVMDAVHAAGVHVAAAQGSPPVAALGTPVASQVVNRVASSWNERLSSATGQVFDLRTIVPLGLGVLAVREILAGRLSAAPWYMLLWWTFDSYWKLRPHPSAPPSGSDR